MDGLELTLSAQHGTGARKIEKSHGEGIIVCESSVMKVEWSVYPTFVVVNVCFDKFNFIRCM